MGSAWDQIVAGAFGGCLGEHGGFDLDKTPFIQKTPKRPADLGTPSQIALHPLPAQIDIAETQPSFVLNSILVKLKRGCLGAVQDLDRLAYDLNSTGRKIWI